MFNNSPANKQIASYQEQSYTLIEQKGLLLTVKSPNLSLDKPGKLFLCNNTVKAVVVSNTTNLQLRLQTFIDVTSVTPYLWLPMMHRQSYYKDPAKIVGSLDVTCKGLKLSKIGFTGWSVFNQQGDLLLAGNDATALGKCSYTSNDSWAPGFYKLEVREFSSENRQAISYAYKWYEITSNSSVIKDLNPGIVLI